MDAFETAARAESERLAPPPEDGDQFHVWNTRNMRDHGVEMAEWARTYLAEQEPSDAEVMEAARSLAEAMEDIEEWDSLSAFQHAGYVHLARLALSAARSVGRDAR